MPEKSIGSSFANEPLSNFGFWADWHVEPNWNLCNAQGTDGKFLESDDKVLVCTQATFCFAVDKYRIEAFDDRLIAVEEFHHVSANTDNKLGEHVRQFIGRDKVHLVAMTGSDFHDDAEAVLHLEDEAVLHPEDEAKFELVTYTHLKQLDLGYCFYSGDYADDLTAALDPGQKAIIHIPSVNSRESTKDKIKEVEHILDSLGDWLGTDPETGFQLVKNSRSGFRNAGGGPNTIGASPSFFGRIAFAGVWCRLIMTSVDDRNSQLSFWKILNAGRMLAHNTRAIAEQIK